MQRNNTLNEKIAYAMVVEEIVNWSRISLFSNWILILNHDQYFFDYDRNAPTFAHMSEKVTLDELLSFFPEVELPIEITEDLVMTAETVNKVFPAVVIEEHIVQWESNEEFDEFTEFVPILQIKETEEFHAIVYWKGGLMRYEYILVTMDKLGNLITRKPLASTLSDGKTVKKSVATIDEDMIIHIMAGENLADGKYDPANSQAFNMEIMHTGDVIFSLGDE